MQKEKKKSLLSKVLSFGARARAAKAPKSKFVDQKKRKNILESFRRRGK